ncbi:MAG: aminopeptidase P family protein [Prevotella sp.]|nr:aminopeptidase P family protein [Prevotella sp.]
MNKDINQRLQDLREVMRREHLAAFIFPSTDPHQSEYVADHWKGREFISGFNGSAGTAVVTLNGAALWTDSRYFIAAAEQLRGTEFQLMRLKMPGTPTIAEWIASDCSTNNEPCTEVGIDGMVSSCAEVRDLITELRRHGGFTLRTNLDPLREIWADRPPIPLAPAFIQPLEYAGEAAHDKLSRIRQALRRQHADGMLMASLDDIAWTLNLRGEDVHCCPVVVSYLLIATDRATLYIDPAKLTPEVKAYLKQEGVATDDYENVARGLKDYFEYNILLDPQEVNYTLFKSVTREIIEAESPVKRMKTVKNEREQLGFRKAMLYDGIAMVKFLKWLDGESEELRVKSEEFATAVLSDSEPAAGANSTLITLHSSLTELGVDQKLTALRAEQPGFRGLSFDTIAAYGTHGAIVHYEPTPETDIPLQPEGLLLLDSGGQYLDGTTDITRTIALGPLTDEMRRVYTLVLKGHIQIELAVFPSGISGTQLDVLAKRAMWREGLSYLHGTGHGVGSFLNVHEGPHQIRMEWKPAPLVAGMTVTDEPGIYLEGRFGVRIENTLLIVPCTFPPACASHVAPDGTSEFGPFLRFEPLTLCPIDKRPIVRDMLDDEEIRWLNDYHQTVYDRLAPHLAPDEQQWLREATLPL